MITRPEADARIIAATQKPVNSSVFAAEVTNVAWKTTPSWFVIGPEDRAINPDLLRFYAKRMGAKTTEIKGRAEPFLSHPKAVATVIEAAAK
jgi:hypothetical protein